MVGSQQLSKLHRFVIEAIYFMEMVPEFRGKSIGFKRIRDEHEATDADWCKSELGTVLREGSLVLR